MQLVRCLAELRAAGLTIICVIHQPRYAVFREFSHLLLLGKGGRQIYCGVAHEVTSYLTGVGFKLPEYENAADWMIDVVSGHSTRYLEDGKVDADFKAPEDLFVWWQNRTARKKWMPKQSSEFLPELVQREVHGTTRQSAHNTIRIHPSNTPRLHVSSDCTYG